MVTTEAAQDRFYCTGVDVVDWINIVFDTDHMNLPEASNFSSETTTFASSAVQHYGPSREQYAKYPANTITKSKRFSVANTHNFVGMLLYYNNNNGRNGSCLTWLATS